MGLMNKLNKMKNFFFDDEDEEETKKTTKKVKKEDEILKKVEEEKIEELYFEDVSDSDTEIELPKEISSRSEKKENKFDFPEFDDDDFAVAKEPEVIVETPKPEPLVSAYKPPSKKNLYQGSKRREDNKKFKPSPFISPVYGLLDEEGNHVKVESVNKDNSSDEYEETSLDAVRRKAYGYIDTQFENTIQRLSTKTIEEAEKEAEKLEKIERMEKELKELKREERKPKKITVTEVSLSDSEEDDDDDDMILPSVSFKEIDIDKERNKSKKEKIVEKKVIDEDDDDEDDTKEQDLFNLIDTMYQKEEDE